MIHLFGEQLMTRISRSDPWISSQNPTACFDRHQFPFILTESHRGLDSSFMHLNQFNASGSVL